MSEIIQENNITKTIDIDESNKNDEDLLAFSSKYKATSYKEDEYKANKKKQKNKDRKISSDSTSISVSHEYSNLSINSKKLNNIINDEILNNSMEFNETKKKYQERQRKMSSPLCFYFDGSDIFLSKTQKTYVDLKNSLNFIKKENWISSSAKIINRLKKKFMNKKETNNNYNLNYMNHSQSDTQEKMENKNGKNKRSSPKENQMIPDLNYNYNYIAQQNINNNLFYNYNNYQQQLMKLNFINLNNLRNNLNNNRKLSYTMDNRIIGNYFNNILNFNNSYNQMNGNYNPFLFSYNREEYENMQNKNHKKLNDNSIPEHKNPIDKKPFDKRKGDWFCPDCHNLNFAFRFFCNRCQRPKDNSLTQILDNDDL